MEELRPEGTSMNKLTGKVAMVTGASKGMGAAAAKALAAEGAAVAVNYSSGHEAAEWVVSQIRSGGGRAIAIQADVSKKGRRRAHVRGNEESLRLDERGREQRWRFSV
jgi:NAD(P)-dependent dehydrogenase (short-subunit alcohol dehydrogenase family)